MTADPSDAPSAEHADRLVARRNAIEAERADLIAELRTLDGILSRLHRELWRACPHEWQRDSDAMSSGDHRTRYECTRCGMTR